MYHQHTVVNPSKEDMLALTQEISLQQDQNKKNMLLVKYNRYVQQTDCDVAPMFNVPGIHTLRIESSFESPSIVDLITLVLESEHCNLKRVEIGGECSQDYDRFREAVIECESLCELMMPCRYPKTYGCLVALLPHCKLRVLCMEAYFSNLAKFTKALSRCHTITRLDLSNSLFPRGPVTARFFQSLPHTITELLLNHCQYLDMSISQLISRLPELNLRVLEIQGTSLLPSTAMELASNLGSLEELNLKTCQIDATGTFALVRALRQDGCQLRVLNLIFNGFPDVCMRELCISLPRCRLEVLSISLYRLEEKATSFDFANALRSGTCTLLELNVIRNDGHIAMQICSIWNYYLQVLAMLSARSVPRVGRRCALRKLPAEMIHLINDMTILRL